MTIIPIVSTQWIFRNIVIKMQNCLQSTDKIRIYRGFKKSSSSDIILKIITLYQNMLKQYHHIITNARRFYSRQKHTEDFILKAQHVLAYYTSENIPKTQNVENQQSHLYLTRPYFAGSNFHQSVYVNEKLPYKRNQFQLFIKQSIRLMSEVYYSQGLKPTFLPTLQNIYLDDVNLNANLLSVQSIMFLKHKMAHISIQNFKHLYLLLKSDPQIFVDWQKMQTYMGEQMLCRSILILWICFMTLRSPIEIVWETKLNDQQLEWNHLLVQNTIDNNKVINQTNKIIQLVKDAPKLWSMFLNKPQNIKCFEIFSQQLFQNTSQQLDQQKKYYFHKLFLRVFVKQEKFGWKQLFQLKDIFTSLIQTPIQEKLLQTQKQQEDKRLKQLQEIKRNKMIKIQVIKQSFIYVHKYFLYKDIIKMKMSKQQANKYANMLNFRTYLPYKLNLSIQTTLDYHNWFQVFFTESQECQPQVYDAANYLFDTLQKQTGEMLQHVIFAQFYHIKRVLYLLGMKIAQNKQMKHTYKILEKQIDKFISQRRDIEYSLNSLGELLKIVSMSQTEKPLQKLMLQYCKQEFKKDQQYTTYDDLAVLLVAYFKEDKETTNDSIENKANYDKNWDLLKILFKDKVQQAFRKDNQSRELQNKQTKGNITPIEKYQHRIHFKKQFVKSISEQLGIKKSEQTPGKKYKV